MNTDSFQNKICKSKLNLALILSLFVLSSSVLMTCPVIVSAEPLGSIPILNGLVRQGNGIPQQAQTFQHGNAVDAIVNAVPSAVPGAAAIVHSAAAPVARIGAGLENVTARSATLKSCWNSEKPCSDTQPSHGLTAMKIRRWVNLRA